MRVRNDSFMDLVSALRIAVHAAVPQRIRPRTLDLRLKIALLIVEKIFTVADQELKIAYLRAVNVGIVDFGQNSIPDREPDPARRRVGRPHAVLFSVSPARRDTRLAKGLTLSTKLRHAQASSMAFGFNDSPLASTRPGCRGITSIPAVAALIRKTS